jgi:hypothetical protein
MTSKIPINFLLIGRPRTTKTTFLAQFYAKAESKNGAIKLEKHKGNLKPIIEALGNLSAGLEVQSTEGAANAELELLVSAGDEMFELICPDYGGEQVNELINNYEVSDTWQTLVQKSNNWIVLIRPLDLSISHNLVSKNWKEEDIDNSKKTEFNVSEQSKLIELIQILSNIKALSYQEKIRTVRLTIALTCWDELGDNYKVPKDCLKKYLPLFSNFIDTNWEEGTFKILGLSAQGLSLNNPENKEKYLDEGMEKFPYIIRENGEKVHDITELIFEAV